MKKQPLWVYLIGGITVAAGWVRFASAQDPTFEVLGIEQPGEEAEDPAALQEELQAVQEEIRHLAQSGQPVPPDLIEYQQELQRRMGPARGAAAGRTVDPRVRAEYEDLLREMHEIRAAGETVPPEMQQRIETLRQQMMPAPRTTPRGPQPNDEQVRRLEERLEDLTQQKAALEAGGEPVPRELEQQIGVLRGAINRFRGAAASSQNNAAAMQLAQLRQQIQQFQERGDPVPEPLLQRELALQRAVERQPVTGRGGSRRAALQQEYDRLVQRADQLEAQGLPLPEDLVQRGQELEDLLADPNLDNEADVLDPRAAAGGVVPRQRPGAADPGALRLELARIESSIQRIEATGAAVPDALVQRYDALQQQLEAAELNGQQAAATPTAVPAAPNPALSAEEQRLQKLQEHIARLEAQGIAVPEALAAHVAQMEERLASAPQVGAPTPGVNANVPNESPDPREQDMARLAKIQQVMEQLHAAGQPVPERLIQAAETLERRVHGLPDQPPGVDVALPGAVPGEPAATENPAEAYRELLEQIREVQATGQPLPHDMILKLRELRKEMNAARSAQRDPGDDDRDEAVSRLEARLRGVDSRIEQLRSQGQPVPDNLTRLSDALKNQLASMGRGSAATGPIPIEHWASYVAEKVDEFGFDAEQQAAAAQILEESEQRAQAMIAADAGAAVANNETGTLPLHVERRVHAVFRGMDRQIEALRRAEQR